MSRIPWSWYDPVEDETYYMPVNPYQDNGSNNIVRTTSYEVNAATYQDQSGVDRIGNLVYHSSDDVPKQSYTGRLYTQDEVEDFTAVVEKNNALTLTDDLDRSYSVLIESFTLNRVRARNRPYKHEYSLTFIVLEEL